MEMYNNGDVVLARMGIDWIIGYYQEGNLNEPRAYLFDGKQHGIMNLPGNPGNVSLSRALYYYKVNSEEILNLYTKQLRGETDNVVLERESPIIVPS